MTQLKRVAQTVSNTVSDRFRLRRLVEELAGTGELDTIKENVLLIDVARYLNGNPKAVYFKSVGREGVKLVGNVLGSRRRIVAALGVSEQKLLPTMIERLKTPTDPVEIAQADAS